VIDRIAAGEVVERPASAVKELVENALDAGASRIDIEIDGGGVDRILVRDDGSGMTPEDARLALERHATSKITTDDDLARVGTYGFRGEALPSIAAVSKLTLTTSDGSSPDAAAVRIRSDYGGKPSREAAARPRGTDVLIESLFETTPARRKFLASVEAEARAVAVVVTKAALSNPSVRVAVVATDELIRRLSTDYETQCAESPWEHKIFDTLGEARAWATEQHRSSSPHKLRG